MAFFLIVGAVYDRAVTDRAYSQAALLEMLDVLFVLVAEVL